MYWNFHWTPASLGRLRILCRYEPIQPFLLFELANALAASRFVDIGANVGAYSVLLSSLDSITHTHAFEASPGAARDLAENVRLNEQAQQKTTVHTIAVSDRCATARFGIASEYSGENGIVETSIHPSTNFGVQVEVPCATLDSVLDEREQVICMKIDVEGHEEQVLRGASRTLRENGCLLQVEEYGRDGRSLGPVLQEFGYRQLMSVGPDNYFTNIGRIDDGMLLGAFQRASRTLIALNLSAAPVEPRDWPIRVALPAGIAVEVEGGLATFARRVKKAISRS